jgi:hypothetical protein
MTLEEIDRAAVSIVEQLLKRLPDKKAQSEVLSMLLLVSYNALRNIEDDQFVIGWLESALKDVRENPPATGPRARPMN